MCKIFKAGHENLQNYLTPVKYWSGIENGVTNSMKCQNVAEIAAAWTDNGHIWGLNHVHDRKSITPSTVMWLCDL